MFKSILYHDTCAIVHALVVLLVCQLGSTANSLGEDLFLLAVIIYSWEWLLSVVPLDRLLWHFWMASVAGRKLHHWGMLLQAATNSVTDYLHLVSKLVRMGPWQRIRSLLSSFIIITSSKFHANFWWMVRDHFQIYLAKEITNAIIYLFEYIINTYKLKFSVN